MIQKLLRTLNLISYRGYFLKNLISSAGSITSLELLLSIKSHCDNFKTIIDAGANIGQFALASSYIFPDAQIYSFEALPKLYKNLKHNLRKLKKCKVYNLALNSEKKEIKFFECKYTHVSSALKPLNDKSAFKEITVNSDTLDNILSSENIEKLCLLKLDVQGFEKEVMKGANYLLNKIDFTVMEVSFMQSYQNEPLFLEMNDYMSYLNFRFIAPVNILYSENYKITQMDVLYIRK